MIVQNYTVYFENGLHARPSAELVKLLRPFISEVEIIQDCKRFNLKSIIHIMSLSITKDDVISIEINGIDEKEVQKKLTQFFDPARSF